MPHPLARLAHGLGPSLALALLCSCASPPPMSRSRPAPAPAHPAESVEFHAPATPAAAAIPPPRLRLEEPYVFGALPDRIAFTPAELDAMKNDVRAGLRAAFVPTGPETELHSSGVATLDHWLHYGPAPVARPPEGRSRYRLLYRDGRPFEAWRHDETGARLVQKIYYAEGMIPAGSVDFDARGEAVRYAHLAYDRNGLIKRVVVFDRSGEPLLVLCRAHRDVYLNGEYIQYSRAKNGEAAVHVVTEDSVVFRVEDGVRRQINRGSLLRTITSLEKHGVRPLYPLPEGFVRPAGLEPWKSGAPRPPAAP